MHITGIIPQTSVDLDTTCSDRREAVRELKKKYPQALVESIDGVFVRGLCEGCETPVMEDDEKFGYSQEDSVYLCPSCMANPKPVEDL